MDFTSNNIKVLPDITQTFTLLQEFLFSRNSLTDFPEFMGQLINLRVIDVSKNNIKVIPLELRSLLHLETLIISDNQVTHLPLFLGTLPKLSFLAVARNPIEEYPEDLIESSQNGGTEIIVLLRTRLNEYFSSPNVKLPYILSESDETLIASLRERQKESPQDFSVTLPSKPVTYEKKFVCRTLKPKCERKPVAIQKISDGIWCGMEDGSICHWDSRVKKFHFSSLHFLYICKKISKIFFHIFRYF